jgi:hypothetical protein
MKAAGNTDEIEDDSENIFHKRNIARRQYLDSIRRLATLQTANYRRRYFAVALLEWILLCVRGKGHSLRGESLGT